MMKLHQAKLERHHADWLPLDIGRASPRDEMQE
jgi:hypothetical protein